MEINWGDAAVQHQYEDMVSALLCLIEPDSLHIDGKGGDGGRDVIRETPEGLIIFECKRFPDRLNEKRKTQIRRSLTKAAGHKPIEWNLVLPIDPTPGEKTFFDRLKKKYDFPLKWLGRTWLNAHMAKHPEIRRYFLEDARDEVLKLVAEMQLEVRDLTTGTDAIERLRKLHDRLNELDIHYSFALATGAAANQAPPPGTVLSQQGGDVRLDVLPRHRSALRKRPITGSYAVQFSAEDADLREAFVRALDFGDPVELPPRVIEEFTLDAPGGLGGRIDGASMTIGSAAERREPPLAASLRVLSEGGDLLRELPVEFADQRAGRRGGTMYGSDSTGMLRLELWFDRDGGEIRLTFHLQPVAAAPGVLRPVVELLTAFGQGVTLELGLGDPVHPTVAMEIDPDEALLPAGFADVTHAFEALQQRARTSFAIPEDLAEDEARTVIEYAQELKPEGRRFTWTDLNLTLNRLDDGAGQEQLLSEGGALVLEGTQVWEFRGRTYDLGARRIVVEHAVVEHPKAVRQRLDRTGQSPIRLVPGPTSDEALARLLEV